LSAGIRERAEIGAKSMDAQWDKTGPGQRLSERTGKALKGGYRERGEHVSRGVLREMMVEEPALNPAELLERVEGDRDLLQELAGLFRDDWPRQLEALREASAAKDVKRIVAASHTLKGMLSNLTAVKAAAMAAAMEMAARRGECAGGNGELAKLEREIARVELALEGMCVEVRR